jgi:hypothetical protein
MSAQERAFFDTIIRELRETLKDLKWSTVMRRYNEISNPQSNSRSNQAYPER